MDFLSVLYEYLFSYTGMAAVGIMLCVAVSAYLTAHYKLEPVRFLFLYVLSVLPVYLGAKLFGVFSILAFRLGSGYTVNFSVLKNAGIVYYGGLFAYLLFMRVALKRFYSGKKYRRVYDIAALLIPLFHGFARIGCYCAHCCYGKVAGGALFASFYEHRVPVQLMESVFELGLFVVLGLRLRGKARKTTLARTYLASYAAFRFLIEFWRGDAVRGFIGPLSFSQWISVFVLVWLVLTRKRKEADPR